MPFPAHVLHRCMSCTNDIDYRFHRQNTNSVTLTTLEFDHIFSSVSDTLLSALVMLSGRGDGSGTGLGW